MNAIKTVTMFQALDGSYQPTERAALLVSVAHLIGCSQETAEQSIDPQLDRLLPILQRLSDPSNRPAKATEGPRTRVVDHEALDTRTLEDVGGCDCSAAMNGASDHHPSCAVYVEPRLTYVEPGCEAAPATGEGIVDPATLSMAVETYTLEDFRPGQLVEVDITDTDGPQPEYRSFMNAIIDHTDTDDDGALDGHVLALRQVVNGVPLSHWNAMARVTEVTRILKQPEDLLDWEEAHRELCAINVKSALAPLDIKRRILLHRRIAELESSMEGTHTHAASQD